MGNKEASHVAATYHNHNEGMQLLPWKTEALTREEFGGQTVKTHEMMQMMFDK